MKVKRNKTFSMRTSSLFINTVNGVARVLGISKSKAAEFLCISRGMMFTSDEDVIEEYNKFK